MKKRLEVWSAKHIAMAGRNGEIDFKCYPYLPYAVLYFTKDFVYEDGKNL